MKKRNRSTFAAIALLLFRVLLVPAIAGGADNSYHILERYKLNGNGKIGNIRVDIDARRLYVAHGDHVDVVNSDTGARVGMVPANGANDVVIAAGIKRGFISNGGDQSVTVFDPATLKVVKTIKLPVQNPKAMEYDSDVKRVFVAAVGGVAVIDADSADLAGTVSMDGHLGRLICNGYGRLFVAAEDKNLIHIVDTHALKLLGDFPIGDGKGPTGLALDPSGRRLFVACSNGRLPIIDTDIGFTFEELPIGEGEVSDVFTFAPQGNGGWRGAVFVVSADGTLALVKMIAFISYARAGELKLQPGLDSVGFDPNTHRVFIPAGSNGGEILVLGP